MSSDIKKPDRLNISKNAKEIIDSIDSTNYFSLGDKTTSRSELFLFAMALGIDTIPTQFYCNCSKERVEQAVASIGRKDLVELIEEGKDIEEVAF